MKNYLFVLMLFIFHSSVNAQSNDITVDAKGKPIANIKTNFKNFNVESLTDFFYANIGNVKEIDKIISYSFYKATPYYKFKSLMSAKELKSGKFIKKEILKIDYSADRKKATIFLKVKYSNLESMEQIVFFKEFEKDDYNIVEYSVK